MKQYTLEEQEILYAAGFGHYEAGSYGQAIELFTQLALTEPLEEKYWRGFASAHQMALQYPEALKAWSLVALMADNDPLPHFHAAECLLSMDDKAEGLKALNAAEALLKENDVDLRSKINLLQNICQP